MRTRPKTARKGAQRAAGKTSVKRGNWNLRLYVAGQTAKSITAIANLKRICEQHMEGEYEVEVIDLIKQPQLARSDQIIAIPTLVRKVPSPMRRIIGDLSSTERVLVGLELSPDKNRTA